MSSLLQFNGRIGRKGVRLELIHAMPRQDREDWRDGNIHSPWDYPDGYMSVSGRWLPRIYVCWRKPVGMFGCWAVFRMNGTEEIPDLSTPWEVKKLPRDAKPLSDKECDGVWLGLGKVKGE